MRTPTEEDPPNLQKQSDIPSSDDAVQSRCSIFESRSPAWRLLGGQLPWALHWLDTTMHVGLDRQRNRDVQAGLTG